MKFQGVWRDVAGLMLVGALVAGCGGSDTEVVVSPPPAAPAVQPFFLDPTVSMTGEVEIGTDVYVGPFARLNAGAGQIRIGDRSDVQDNVTLNGSVILGDNVICAHGCTVEGPATLGETGGDPAFVGFNSLVSSGATVEGGAMVSAKARLGPGLTLRSGFRILPGQNVQTQAEADDPALGKVVVVTDADLAFMDGVLHVNEALSRGYAAFRAQDVRNIQGISQNPYTDLQPIAQTPVLAGQAVLDPSFRNRIIGQVILADTLQALSLVMGERDSLRADEGAPFALGTLAAMDDEVTFHALEGSEIVVGNNCEFGFHVVIHGGEDDGNVPTERTVIGDDVVVGDEAVVFRSTLGDGCVIGEDALVDGCQLAPGTVVPARTILVDNVDLGTVDW